MPEVRHHLLVPNEAHTAVLVATGDGRTELPSVAGEDWGTSELLDAARRELTLDATYLRPAGVARDAGRKLTDVLHELDAPGATWAPPPGLTWLDRAGAEVDVAPPGLATPLERWLEMEDGAPVHEARPPWARHGWRDQALDWILDRARASGLEPTGDAELLEQWPLSSVWRLATGDGLLYFKGVFSLFRHEPAITVALADRHPELVPRVLAVDESRGWILMRELPGEQLGDTDRGGWGKGLSAMAGVHRAWAGKGDAVLGLGAQDRTLASLVEELPGVIAAVELDAADRDRVTGALEAVPALAERLDRGPLPHTLVHGDFHPWNVVVADGEIGIFDWSDACVAHPLFDLPTFVRRASEEAERAALVEQYLSAWTDHAPIEDLRELTALAGPLAAVHHAISYLRILEALEPDDRWYFDEVPAKWLVEAADAIDALPEVDGP